MHKKYVSENKAYDDWATWGKRKILGLIEWKVEMTQDIPVMNVSIVPEVISAIHEKPPISWQATIKCKTIIGGKIKKAKLRLYSEYQNTWFEGEASLDSVTAPKEVPYYEYIFVGEGAIARCN